MNTTALPRRTPRKHRAPEQLCDYCVWPAGYISPETGALVCDPYAHTIEHPERCHALVVDRDHRYAGPLEIDLTDTYWNGLPACGGDW